MAELIQFNCPACGVLLRLPLTMAASQGPCPVCAKVIVAPDPYRGLGAFEKPFPPPVEAPKPFVASAPEITPPEQDPVRPNSPEDSQPDHESPDLTTHEPHASQANPARTILVLSCLLTALGAFVAGYAVGEERGKGKEPLLKPTPPPVTESPIIIPTAPAPEVEAPPVSESPAPPPAETKPTETEAILVKPKVPAPKSEENQDNQKVSAAAEASLRAFLEAPDWVSRSAHVLGPDKVRNAMEAYSKVVPDGPTRFISIKVEQSQTDQSSGNTLFIFKVATEEIPEGIPAAVAETDKGWLIDWQAFVEFRDDQFKKFAEGPTDQIGRFHLIVRPIPEAEDQKSGNGHFASFLLDPPFPGRQQSAFVKKDSKAHATLIAGINPSGIYTPVLEVAKRGTPDGKSFLEITRVTSPDWRPPAP